MPFHEVRAVNVSKCQDYFPDFIPTFPFGAIISPALSGGSGVDWNAAIEKNREALKCVLATLFAMAGLTAGPDPEVRAEGEPRRTLPRHLHRAVIKLLCPAEAAARRLVIVMARGMMVALLPPRPRKPKPFTAEPLLRSLGIAVVVSPADVAGAAAAARLAAIRAARPRRLNLPLFDPLKRPLSLSKGRCHRRTVPAYAAPRILFPGIMEPFSLPPPPSPDDPVDAARLALRLEALGRALDDLPGQAKRFARWRARRDAAGAQKMKGRDAARAQEIKGLDAARAQGRPAFGRIRRTSPLRPGRPPGGRLARYDPDATHPRKIREVDEILAHAHALALYALEHPDTS